jgi:hypothetical protein
MRRPVSILMAATLAASSAALGVAPAAAVTPAPAISTGPAGAAIPVESDNSAKWWYRGQKHGHGHHHNRHDHRYYDYDDDDYDAGAAFLFGAIGGLTTGAIIGSQRSYGGSGWAAACAAKYRSFDPRTGTYLGYDGYRHPCRL